jgi:hypothetical protein
MLGKGVSLFAWFVGNSTTSKVKKGWQFNDSIAVTIRNCKDIPVNKDSLSSCA